METMKPSTRLGWSIAMVVGSVVYAILVAIDSDLASALMLGYVGLLLTVFVTNEIWRDRHGG